MAYNPIFRINFNGCRDITTFVVIAVIIYKKKTKSSAPPVKFSELMEHPPTEINMNTYISTPRDTSIYPDLQQEFTEEFLQASLPSGQAQSKL